MKRAEALGSESLSRRWCRRELGHQAIEFTGPGLHSGHACRLGLQRSPGPLKWRVNGEACCLSECSVVGTHLGVVLATPTGQRLGVVEHLLSALAGLWIHEGLMLEVTGPEIPLLDGSSKAFVRALLDPLLGFGTGSAPLGSPSPRLEITRAAQLSHGSSRYRFTPGSETRLDVEVEFRQANLGTQRASWQGCARDYATQIAWARTFGFASEAPELRRRGLAAGADPESVLIIAPNGTALAPGEAPRPEELARHKLLDLLGDAYWYGGAPRGTLHAIWPGHTATHAVFKRALAEGILLRQGPEL